MNWEKMKLKRAIQQCIRTHVRAMAQSQDCLNPKTERQEEYRTDHILPMPSKERESPEKLSNVLLATQPGQGSCTLQNSSEVVGSTVDQYEKRLKSQTMGSPYFCYSASIPSGQSRKPHSHVFGLTITPAFKDNKILQLLNSEIKKK